MIMLSPAMNIKIIWSGLGGVANTRTLRWFETMRISDKKLPHTHHTPPLRPSLSFQGTSFSMRPTLSRISKSSITERRWPCVIKQTNWVGSKTEIVWMIPHRRGFGKDEGRLTRALPLVAVECWLMLRRRPCLWTLDRQRLGELWWRWSRGWLFLSSFLLHHFLFG